MIKPRQILKRIKTIERTSTITHAMEIIASIQLKKLEQILYKYNIYQNKFEEILERLFLYSPKNFSIWFKPRSDDNYLIIIIGSDRGLCGGFNADLLKELNAKLSQYQDKKIIDIISLGRKCSWYCKRKFSKEGIINIYNQEEEIAEKLANKIMEDYLNEKIDNVFLLATKYRSHGESRIYWKKILPIGFDSKEGGRKIDYLLEPNLEELVEKIVFPFIKSTIYKFILESRASEELARMLAMKYATDNAQELIEELKLKYYRARQTQITRELLDITQTQK